MIKGTLDQLSSLLEKDEVKLIELHIYQIKKNKINIGEWVHLKEDNLKSILLNSSNYSEGVFETHQKYIDIHITIKGEDFFYIGENENSELINTYNKELDYSLFKSKIKNQYKIEKNNFILVNPEELHINEIRNNKTLKLVVKKHL